MSRTMRVSLCSLMLAGLVTACGSGGGGGTTVGGGSGKSADWALDACKTFPLDAAAKAAGVEVTKAETSGQVSNEVTLVSNCSYSRPDGKTNFGVLLRQDKALGDTVDVQIAGLKSQPDLTGPFEDVAMPKGKAIWSPKLRTISYVPEAGRMIVVTPPGAVVFGGTPAPDAEVKAKAIAIALAADS